MMACKSERAIIISRYLGGFDRGVLGSGGVGMLGGADWLVPFLFSFLVPTLSLLLQ